MLFGTDNIEKLIISEKTQVASGSKHSDKHVTANLLIPPQAIFIKKYNDHDCRTVLNKLLWLKSNQKMNAYLKERDR